MVFMDAEAIQKKLRAVGINSVKELNKIIGGHLDLSYKIWNGRAPLSKDRAIIIKEKTGASLDFLLS